MSSSRSLCSPFFLAEICIFLALSASTAQGIPAETYHAKTVFIRNNAGGAPLEKCGGRRELSKWGPVHGGR